MVDDEPDVVFGCVLESVSSGDASGDVGCDTLATSCRVNAGPPPMIAVLGLFEVMLGLSATKNDRMNDMNTSEEQHLRDLLLEEQSLCGRGPLSGQQPYRKTNRPVLIGCESRWRL